MNKRQQQNTNAINDYIDRCEAEATLLGELTNFLTVERAAGRTVIECRLEVGRRWPGTRYSTFKAALAAAENIINQH